MQRKTLGNEPGVGAHVRLAKLPSLLLLQTGESDVVRASSRQRHQRNDTELPSLVKEETSRPRPIAKQSPAPLTGSSSS